MNLSFNLKEMSSQQIKEVIQKSMYISSIDILVPYTNFINLLDITTLFLICLAGRPLVSLNIIPQFDISQISQQVGKYNYVALGGTFDYFHTGHKILLTKAALLARKKLIIGLTGPLLLKNKKNKQLLQDFYVRQRRIRQFVNKIKKQLTVRVFQLEDIYGPALRPQIDALIVSQQTITGGYEINKVRIQRQLKPLQIIICPAITLQSCKSNVVDKISSSTTREYMLTKNYFNISTYQHYRKYWFDSYQIFQNLFIVDPFQKEPRYAIAIKWWDYILTVYSQYWRFYHTNFHIYSLLTQFQSLCNTHKLQLDTLQKGCIIIIIFFHDAVYLPNNSANEFDSANIAELYLRQQYQSGIPSQSKEKFQYCVKIVKEGIASTKAHIPKNKIESIINDLDMSIISSPIEQYRQYAYQIRKQYQPLVGIAYPQKRIEFLKTINIVKENKQEQKRIIENIEWEISQLSKQLDKTKNQL